MKRENLLTILILAALVLGALWGQYGIFKRAPMVRAADDAAAEMAPDRAYLKARAGPLQEAGDLVFIRPLRMMIVPLVFLSVVVGVCSIGDPSRLGKVGGATLFYFAATTLIAVGLGLAIANTVSPGRGVDAGAFEASAQQEFKAEVAAKVEAGPRGIGAAFMNLARDMIPSNIADAAVKGNVLGLVVFAILLGAALAVVGARARPAVDAMEALLEGCMKIIGWVLWLAPVGVFCIVAGRVGSAGLSNLVGPLSLYILCVLGGLILHLLVVLPVILGIFGRTNPYRFLWEMRKVILTAFSTASSSATLPVTIEECRRVGGCSKRAATFVPALGATVNMNGTALYEAVAVLFLFQVYHIDLTIGQQLVILLTATLAAVGAPGIPGAGLVTMAIIINAVNASLVNVPGSPQLPLYTIGIIVGVDRFLDMCRTVLNVMGDAIGARLITRIAPD